MIADAAGIDHLLEEVWSLGGTDLLLTPGAPPLARVDGVLRAVPGQRALNADDVGQLVCGVLGPRVSDAFDRSKQADFAFTWRDVARVRGNAFRQRGSAALALRLIPLVVPTFEQLGTPPVVREWTQLPKGFVLVTGPSGAGKSTTLAAMVDHINSTRAVHVITIEDPIEYVHHHRRSAVNQREVGEDTDSFADALRAALREDPDVVLVGEMRDPESIQAALTIAETGHLVLASVHTNDTAQTLDRIVDVFPSERQPQVRLQLAHTLVGIVNQALAPRVGSGRVAAYEVLVATHAIRNLIREGKTRQLRNLVATGQREGMHTLESSLSDLVASGMVSYEDALRCTVHPEDVRPPKPAAEAVR